MRISSTTPLAPGEAPDYQFGFTNITTALSAERVLFNSRTHMDGFITALPAFIRMMPDCRPSWIKAAIQAKSGVACPGCHLPPVHAPEPLPDNDPPLIIWNHRWEHDKNPEDFFKALSAMRTCGIDFRVAVLGEAYARTPAVFDTARAELGDRIVHWGYMPSRHDYHRWLRRGRVVISTALQENFGISVVEAMGYGCLPLLPHRLAYPEILPEAFHDDFLYRNQTDLEEKLAILLTGGHEWEARRESLSAHMQRYAWGNCIHRFDKELSRLGAGGTLNQR